MHTLEYLHYTCYKFIDWLGVSSGSSGALRIDPSHCCCTRIRSKNIYIPNRRLGLPMPSKISTEDVPILKANTCLITIGFRNGIENSFLTMNQDNNWTEHTTLPYEDNLWIRNNRWIENLIRTDDAKQIQIRAHFGQLGCMALSIARLYSKCNICKVNTDFIWIISQFDKCRTRWSDSYVNFQSHTAQSNCW